MVGGTVFLDWERLEPVGRIGRSDDDGVEDVAPARLNSRFGYEGACLNGLKV